MNSAQNILAACTRRQPRRLVDIWPNTPSELTNIIITGIQQDSRLLQAGEAWLSLPPAWAKKEEYIAMAVNAGASLCIHVGLPQDIETTKIPMLFLKDMAEVGSWLRHWFGTQQTSTRVIGITGTDGKTSVTWMLRHALEKKMGQCWSAGTLGWVRGSGDSIPLGNTTASLLTNHQLLAAASDASVSYLLMEVSSHGIDQQRIAGISFAAAVWTTMGRDHLDYHTDVKDYQKIKAGFIDAVQRGGGDIIANADQPDIVTLRNKRATWWYATNGNNSSPVEKTLIWSAPCVGSLALVTAGNETIVEPVPVGPIHGQNLAAVATLLLRHCGDDLATIAATLSHIDAPAGRMEAVADDAGRRVFVDYAHTPNALTACLMAARELSPKRLFLVFGCGGERDQGKRPLMGQVAVSYADRVWLTNDNPRGEDPACIITDILSFERNENQSSIISVVLDRGLAIAAAITALSLNDVLVIAGKGHENHMLFANGVQEKWSDVTQAHKALKANPC